MSQLKPCPACGKNEYEIRYCESGLNMHIMCNCRKFCTLWRQSLAACEAEWNHRPAETRLQSIIAAQALVIEAASAVIITYQTPCAEV